MKLQALLVQLIPNCTASHDITYAIVSRKYAPPHPFAILALVQNAEGAYMRDATISLTITPSDFLPVKHDLIVGGGWGQVRDGEILPTLAVG